MDLDVGHLTPEQLKSLVCQAYERIHKCKGSLMRCCEEWRCETCHVQHLHQKHTKHEVDFQRKLSDGAMLMWGSGLPSKREKRKKTATEPSAGNLSINSSSNDNQSELPGLLQGMTRADLAELRALLHERGML